MSNASPSEPDRGGAAPVGSQDLPNSPVPTLGFAGAIVGNLVFLRLLGSRLPPDAFAKFAAAMALALPALLPALVAQATSAARGRWLATHGRGGEIVTAFDAAARRIAIVALLIAVAVGVLPVAAQLRLDPLTVIVAPLIGGALLLQGRATGLLLGAGRPFAFAGIVGGEALLRAAVALPLLGGSDPVRGLMLAALVTAGAAAAFARALLPPRVDPTPAQLRRRPRTALVPLESWSATAALFAWGMLAFLDVPLSRIEQLPADAERFASVAVVGRFLLLLPLPLGLFLAANTKLRLGRRLPVGGMFGRVFLLIAIALLLGVLAVTRYGDRILVAFFGSERAALVDLYSAHAKSLTLYGLALPLILFGLAAGRVSLALLAIPALLFEAKQFVAEGRTIERCLNALLENAVLYLAIVVVVVMVPLLRARARRLAPARAPSETPRPNDR